MDVIAMLIAALGVAAWGFGSLLVSIVKADGMMADAEAFRIYNNLKSGK